MTLKELKYWIALKSLPGIGNAAIISLARKFSTLAEVFSLSRAVLCAMPGISASAADAIVTFNAWDLVMRDLEKMHEAGIRPLTCFDAEYPARLLNIYDFPALLYVKGNLDTADIGVAVVGSRRASAHGRYTTDRISRQLAQRGITIVSGMARGIDSSAHRAALAVNGRTIAVLGCGPDVVYPPENRDLYDAIAKGGAIVSEYAPQTRPMPFHFPSRNRIISGMSYGVVVVEAGEKSGSLITARLAMEQGREVFAIPGPIDLAQARGTNSLIKQGAKLIDSVDDILEDILPQVEVVDRETRIAASPSKAINNHTEDSDASQVALNETQKRIYDVLKTGRLHADDIIALTSFSPADTLGALMTLELKGIVHQHPGKFFSLKESLAG